MADPFDEDVEAISNAILIAGPTASGKSALALALAQATGRIIVNADSMQVYDRLRIVTARPDEVALAAAPHHLYGHVTPGEAYSTGAWLRDVASLVAMPGIAPHGHIFVGGTGLYFKALTQGLSPMPDVPDTVREAWRARLVRDGPHALHAVLAERDGDAARRLDPADGQRIVRALEVLEASGRSILAWQARKSRPLIDPFSAQCLLVGMDDADLGNRIDRRFRAMMAEGAIEEVRDLLSMGLDATSPAMRAIGVPQIAALLEGRSDREMTARDGAIATRQYAKRQRTWFRNQFGPEWKRRDVSQLMNEIALSDNRRAHVD